MTITNSIKKFTDWIVGINQPSEDSIDEDKLHYELETLDLPENGEGILVVKSDYPSTLEVVYKYFKSHKHYIDINCPVLLVDKSVSIEALSNKKLHELGLQRINKEEVTDE